CSVVYARAPPSHSEMDLARRPDRACPGVAKRHLANPARLAHLGAVAQHRAEQQKRRPHARAIHGATSPDHESGRAPAVAGQAHLATRLARPAPPTRSPPLLSLTP